MAALRRLADADGTFYFVNRLKDAIRRRGKNISSFDVEREVNAFPGVLESAAFAVPSQHTEDEVAVCVVAKPGVALDADALRTFLERRMPKIHAPDPDRGHAGASEDDDRDGKTDECPLTSSCASTSRMASRR